MAKFRHSCGMGTSHLGTLAHYLGTLASYLGCFLLGLQGMPTKSHIGYKRGGLWYICDDNYFHWYETCWVRPKAKPRGLYLK